MTANNNNVENSPTGGFVHIKLAVCIYSSDLKKFRPRSHDCWAWAFE